MQGEVLRWIIRWLSDRLQRIQVNRNKTNWLTVSSGVLLGSILGLLLFIIYFKDFDRGITSDISNFTDDTNIGRLIKSDNDAESLQKKMTKFSRMGEQSNDDI